MEQPHVTSWRKSSYSAAAGDCVEAATAPQAVAVRDSKARGTGPVLIFSRKAWTAFTAGLRES